VVAVPNVVALLFGTGLSIAFMGSSHATMAVCGLMSWTGQIRRELPGETAAARGSFRAACLLPSGVSAGRVVGILPPAAGLCASAAGDPRRDHYGASAAWPVAGPGPATRTSAAR
jgi:hypothetical protein